MRSLDLSRSPPVVAPAGAGRLRSGYLLRMANERPVLAIDIGGTHTRIAVAATPGRPELVARFQTAAAYDEQLAALVDASVGLAPRAVGVSFGGRIDRSGQSVSVSINLKGYEGRRLPSDLADALRCLVRVAHDAVCGLLGEHAYGSLRPYERCGYVTLSTGTGCAIRLGHAGAFVATTTEAAHQLVAGVDRQCSCGQQGCLQTLTGGRLLEARLGRPLDSVDDPGFWRAYAETVALGLANFALSAGIDAIALGGSIILNRPEIWAPLRESLAQRCTYQRLVVLPAELGEAAPLAGATVLLDTDESSILH
jgi:glucokinase